MERDFDTFDPNEGLVDEGRNLYYPAGWQGGDPVFVLNDPLVEDEDGNIDTYWQKIVAEDESPLYELEQRKGLDCE